MSTYLFQSARLGFRHWQDSDIAPFAELNADPVVMEFFPKTASYEETERLVGLFQTHFQKHGFGVYAVDELATGAFIGFIGLMKPRFQAFFTPCVEIGWRLKQAAWGQGYATEGAKRCLQYAHEVLKLSEIYSFTAVLNRRSERVMQKIGMLRLGYFGHPGLSPESPLQPHVVYRVGW